MTRSRGFRTITQGYIGQRLPRDNTIGLNQAYIRRILENPMTPEHNRREAMEYVMRNRDRFTPRPTDTDDPELNEHNRRRNGNAVNGFVERVASMHRYR